MTSDVLLVRLESGDLFPPLGILYTANRLEKAGFKVEIFHEVVNNRTKTKVTRELIAAAEGHEVIGFSVMTYNLSPTVEASKTLKAGGKTIVWGGIHPTLLPTQCIQEDYVDVVVVGEGEETFLELVKKYPSLRGVKGIGYKTQDGIVLEPPRGFLKNLDEYSPSWHLVAAERFMPAGGKRDLPLYSSRGCPYSCSFCYNTAVHRNRWRGQSAKKVISDVAFLQETYGVEKVTFCDDNFFVNKSRAIEISNGIKIPFSADIRASDVNETFLSKLKGKCKHLFIGAESGDERVLKLINKQITPKQTLDALKACKRNEISVRLSFMLGLPFEDELSVRRTLEFIDSALSVHPDLSVGMAIFAPFPGTPLWKTAREYGLELPEALDDWVRFFENWPWDSPIIRDKKRVLNISRICNLAYGGTFASYVHMYKYPYPRFFGRPYIQAIRRLMRFRWRKRMFNHPVELTILDKLSRIKS